MIPHGHGRLLKGWALGARGGSFENATLDQAGDRTRGDEVWFCYFLRASHLPSLSLGFSIYNLEVMIPFLS